MRLKRILAALTAGAAALVVLALAVPVSAGSPDLAAKLAKETGGPYDNNIVRNINPGGAKNVYLKVKNKTGELAEALELSEPDAEPDWVTKYFKGGEEITGAVHSSGSNFKLGAGKTKLFRIRIKAPGSPTPPVSFPPSRQCR